MFAGRNFRSSSSHCTLMMMMMVAAVVLAMTSMAAAMPKGAKSHRRSSESGEAVETVPLQLDPDAFAAAAAAAGSIRPLHNVSISPWAYNVSQDEALFPPMVSEARCLLRGCLDAHGREDLSLRSRPIMHQVLQLRRVRSAGGAGAGPAYHYRLESRLLAVGCTCVRPSVQVQH